MRTDAPVVKRWGDDFKELIVRIGPCFGRHDLRTRAGGYVRGLLARVDRKNGWQQPLHAVGLGVAEVLRQLGRGHSATCGRVATTSTP